MGRFGRLVPLELERRRLREFLEKVKARGGGLVEVSGEAARGGEEGEREGRD